jgi:hypothetical protein
MVYINDGEVAAIERRELKKILFPWDMYYPHINRRIRKIII